MHCRSRSLCLAQCSDIVPAGSGLPAGELAAGRGLRQRAARAWQRRGVAALAPLPAAGPAASCASRWPRGWCSNGVAAGAANIMTTYGASQAFDLLARLLLAPGDAVLVEDPGYFVLFEQLRAHHVRLIPVPRLAEGPDLAALEAACRAHRPRAFFMQTLVHNPDRLERRRRRTATASSRSPSSYGFAVVEDDVYGDLYEGSAVRLAQIDGLRHVIYVGSYTKLIGPALRVGFVAADAALVDTASPSARCSRCCPARRCSRASSPRCSTAGATSATSSSCVRGWRACGASPRSALESDRHRVRRRPRGEGMFLWGRVPDAIPVEELVRRARAQSILLARGALFSAAEGCGQWLRFNVAHSNSPPLISSCADRCAPPEGRVDGAAIEIRGCDRGRPRRDCRNLQRGDRHLDGDLLRICR